jgi:hypothetical protein
MRKTAAMSKTAALSPPPEPERDTRLRTEAIVAAVLTLATIGTQGVQDAVRVVREYRKILQELRATGDSFR